MNAPIQKLQDFFDKTLQGDGEIQVLEAGCGSASHFRFRQRIRLTGIDISEKQLLRNASLHQRILGDLESCALPPASFDVIVCWTVLEHLAHPELALRNLSLAIKEDGLIALGLPNVLSIKGLATKYLPHIFHVWYYRFLWGRKDAGKDDVGPFKTYLRFSVAPAALKRFAQRNKLEVVYYDTYDAGDVPYFLQKTRLARVARRIYNLVRIFARCASFRKLGDSDFVIVFRK